MLAAGGFLALFGAPVAHEDHAQRAVLAALDLRQGVLESKGGGPQPVQLCSGVHTGVVVVGGLGGAAQRLYTAVGETVHLATRLRALAPPGAILISEATQQLMPEEVQLEASDLARRALALSSEHNERGGQAWGLRLLGEIAAHRYPPDTEGAERHYRAALALADELGMRPLLAHCRLGLGTLYAKTGSREQARAELIVAIDLYRAMDMTFWLPQTEAMLAQVDTQ